MTKTLTYQDQLDRDWKVPRSESSYNSYKPDDLLKDLDQLPCNNWTRLKPYDPKTKSVVVQFFFDGGKEDGE